jgi:hypothetical protein
MDAIFLLQQLDRLPFHIDREVVTIENDDRQRHNPACHDIGLVENLCSERIRKQRVGCDSDALADKLCRIGLNGTRAPRACLISCRCGKRRQKKERFNQQDESKKLDFRAHRAPMLRKIFSELTAHTL